MEPVPLHALTSVSGTFYAQVLVARLRSEGIDAQLRGAVGGSYGFTVGDMARVDLYVPADQMEDARFVLLAGEIDATLAAPSEWWDAGVDRPGHRLTTWVASILLLAAVVTPVAARFAGH